MPKPMTTPITDPDFALLELLTDPFYPPDWALFDGMTNSLAHWIEDKGDGPEAPRAMEQMLRNGLSPLVPLREGSTTPLHLAASVGQAPLVRVLTAHLQQTGALGLVDQPASNGATALWRACDGGLNVNVVELLLTAGADPSVQRNGTGLLWLVCSWGANPHRLQILQRLITTSARDRINEQGHDAFGGSTALHKAIAHDNVDAIRLLVAAGADRTLLRNGQDAEALLVERAQDNPEMAALLHEWRVERERADLHRTLNSSVAAKPRFSRRL